MKERTADLLLDWARLAGEAGRELIVEIVPGSLADSYSRFMSEPVWRDLNGKVGFLLDTGHAHVTGENLTILPELMGKRLKGLHLSDNDGKENLSLPAGRGDIDWPGFLSSLERAGYSGSLDLEIGTSPESVIEQYRFGKEFLTNLMNDNPR
jgi:sugar phosphate isomerase/epimerase